MNTYQLNFSFQALHFVDLINHAKGTSELSVYIELTILIVIENAVPPFRISQEDGESLNINLPTPLDILKQKTRRQSFVFQCMGWPIMLQIHYFEL